MIQRTCENCGVLFTALRSDKLCCSKRCAYKRFNDLRPRKTAKSYLLGAKKKTEAIPTSELEIILGCLLGDGSMRLQTDGFHRFSICHCNAQFYYLEWKRKLLPSIFTCQTPTPSETQASIHSISHPKLSELYGLLYTDRKRVTRRYLNLLTPTSILFWFLDDGSRIKASGNSFVLCTDSFSIGENRAIAKWFWQEFKIKAFLLESKGGSFSHGKTYCRLRFRREDSLKLFKVMQCSEYFKDLPRCLRYKFESFVIFPAD